MEDLMEPDKLANAVAGIVTLLIVIGAFARGWLQGSKPQVNSPNGGEVVQIAGALIDGTDARSLTEALDKNTAALKRCGDVTEKSADRVEDATREIRRLADEMIRSQHG